MNNILIKSRERISENNNSYIQILNNLSVELEEKISMVLGTLVTHTNQSADLSMLGDGSKVKLLIPLNKIIESYTIKDLRVVEDVNEQFLKKISDKVDSTNIVDSDSKQKFTESLINLLEEKYLEIIKIKRLPFFSDNNKNIELESCLEEYKNYLLSLNIFDANAVETNLLNFNNDIIILINATFNEVNNLYLNNFINEIYVIINEEVNKSGIIDNAPINNMETHFENDLENQTINENIQVETPVMQNTDMNQVNNMDMNQVSNMDINQVNNMDINTYENITPPIVNPVTMPPAERVLKDAEEQPVEMPSKVTSSNVDQIFELTKPQYNVSSPDVKMTPVFKDDYVSKVIKAEPETKIELNEKELVSEMIRRLSLKLEELEEKDIKCNIEETQLEEDEKYLEELIKNTQEKEKNYLNFKKELEDKQKDLIETEKQLKVKLDSLMPFANAVLKSEKESE